MQTPNLCLVPRGRHLVLLASFYLVRVRIRQRCVGLRPRYVIKQPLTRGREMDPSRQMLSPRSHRQQASDWETLCGRLSEGSLPTRPWKLLEGGNSVLHGSSLEVDVVHKSKGIETHRHLLVHQSPPAPWFPRREQPSRCFRQPSHPSDRTGRSHPGMNEWN